VNLKEKFGFLIVAILVVKLFMFDVPGLTPVIPIRTQATVDINETTNETLLLVSHTSGTVIRFSYHIFSNGTTNWSFVYGTGTNCGSNQVVLDGPYALIAQTGMTGVDMIVPTGNDLCYTNSAAVQVGGSISYIQHNQ
jgi:hypothetical protein